MKKYFLIFTFSLFSLMLSGQTGTPVVSNFSTDTEGWEGGWRIRSSIDAITAGDHYLRLPVGINPGNRGSKLITHNPTELWTGDFLTRGISGVTLNFANWSESDPVYLRLAISNLANPQQSGGTWWTSSTPIYFAPNSGWGSASFQINESSMHRVASLTGELGLDTFNDTLSDINGFRILSSTLGYAAIGDEFYGYVGFDNIELITIPEPSFFASMFTILSVVFLFKRVK